MDDKIQKLYLEEGNFIAYRKLEGKKNYPGVVFLSGFMSDMSGTKATALYEYCRSKNYSYLCFDYFGHGQSSKKFTEGYIGMWLQNVLDVLGGLTTGKQILIGSSMGGWLMLLAALKRPERIAALIGIASAPDFTEDLIWHKMTKIQQKQLLDCGLFNIKSDFSDNPYPVTKQLIFEARQHLLLRDKDVLKNITCPILLIHGQKDMDVPSTVSENLAKALCSSNVTLNLVPEGDHRMSTAENIELLFLSLERILGLTL